MKEASKKILLESFKQVLHTNNNKKTDHGDCNVFNKILTLKY